MRTSVFSRIFTNLFLSFSKIIVFIVCLQNLVFAQTAVTICPYTYTLALYTRGFYFTAPVNFTICGVYVPTDVSTDPQNIEIVRFTTGTPPLYNNTTNNFV